MSNDYIECGVCDGTGRFSSYTLCGYCDGTGEHQALSELLAAFKEAVEENPLVLKDEEPLIRDMPYEGEFIGE